MMNLFISLLVSQNLFARTFGGTSNDHAFSIVQTADGGFVLAGYTSSYGAGGFDILAMKISPTGSLQWARTFGGTGSDQAFSLVGTADGGFAIAGFTTSFDAAGYDIIVLKLNSSGVLSWARTIGTTADDYAYGITQIADGGLVVVGGTTYYDPNEMDILVIKLASDGTYLWGKTLGNEDEYDCARSVVATSDGGAAVAGDLYSYPSGAIVLKFTSAGSLSWLNILGGYFTIGLSITQTTDNGLVVATQNQATPGFRIAKLTSGGAGVWFRVLGGLTSDVPYSVIRTSDGGVAVAGTRYIGSAYDILIFKLASDGSLSWTRVFGGPGYDYPTSIIQTQSGGFALAGYTNSYGAGNNDCLVLTMNSTGNYPDCIYDYSLSSNSYGAGGTYSFTLLDPPLSTISQMPIVNTPALSIYDACTPIDVNEIDPSGSGNRITCSPAPGAALFISPWQVPISLYSADGRLVYSGELQRGENRINLETGVYLWEAGLVRGKIAIR